jgi:hypothetical protein
MANTARLALVAKRNRLLFVLVLLVPLSASWKGILIVQP